MFFLCVFGPYLFFLLYIFLSFLVSNRKNRFSPLEKGIFCLLLSVSLCFSLAFFGLPLFQFLFLCLSLVIFFLSSCLSFFFWFLIFVSFSVFLSSLLIFMTGTTSKYSIAKPFFIRIFSLFWVSCLVFSFNFFFLSLLFPDFKLCFCSTSMYLV